MTHPKGIVSVRLLGILMTLYFHCGRKKVMAASAQHQRPVFSCLQISRLEGQVLRYKTAAENAEKVEDELKAEKRKLQREVLVPTCCPDSIPRNSPVETRTFVAQGT